MADIQMVVGVDYSELTGLVKTGEQTKRVLSSAAKEFVRTGNQKQYMHAINKIVVAQKQLAQASRMTRPEIMKLGARIQQEVNFTDALTLSTKRLTVAQNTSAKVMQQTKNRMNGNNMAIQQLGYQFGDFAVQVQGGTSAFVAFSQQGAQLAGILPMIAGPLGLSMGAAVGLSAALGILIPVGSAVARMFFEMSGTSEKASQSIDDFVSALSSIKGSVETGRKSVKGLREEFGTMAETVKELQGYLQQVSVETALTAMSEAVNPFSVALAKATTEVSNYKATIDQLKKDLEYGDKILIQAEITTAEEGLKGLQDRFKIAPEKLSELQAVLSEVQKATELEDIRDKSGGALKFLEELRKTSTEISPELNTIALELEKVFASSSRATAQLDGTAAAAADGASKSAVDLQKNLEVLSKRSNEWSRSASAGYKVFQKTVAEQRKANDAALEQVRLQNQAIALQDIELKFGKDSAKYRELAAGYELENLVIKLKEANVDEAHIKSLRSGNMALERGNQLLRDQLKITRLIFEGSAAAISMRKFAGRGTTSNKEISGDGIPKSKTKGVKSQAEIDAETIASFQKRIDLEQELLGKSEVRQKVIQALGKDLANSHDTSAMEAQISKTQELIDLEEKRKSIVDSVTGSVENGLMAMVDGTTSVKDAFKSMASEIIKELYRVLVVQRMVAAAKSFLPFADGGVISGGTEVKAYANGGVVGSPTTFPMAGGKTGLMGEAGPEAIMPLKRGSNGKLGVQMEGNGGGDTINVVQNFSFQANGDDSVKKIIAQAAPHIAQMTKNSMLNDRRRGGTTKAVFG